MKHRTACSSSWFFLVGAFSAIGCDGGNWVDGTWAVGCDVQDQVAHPAAADVTKVEGAKKMMTMEAQAICRQAGKAFTGDFRCSNGSGQVKCK